MSALRAAAGVKGRRSRDGRRVGRRPLTPATAATMRLAAGSTGGLVAPPACPARQQPCASMHRRVLTAPLRGWPRSAAPSCGRPPWAPARLDQGRTRGQPQRGHSGPSASLRRAAPQSAHTTRRAASYSAARAVVSARRRRSAPMRARRAATPLVPLVGAPAHRLGLLGVAVGPSSTGNTRPRCGSSYIGACLPVLWRTRCKRCRAGVSQPITFRSPSPRLTAACHHHHPSVCRGASSRRRRTVIVYASALPRNAWP